MAIFLEANWQNIIMANYAVPQTLLTPYLPKGVELDLYKGEAYISLVGFLFKNTKLFSIPIPYFGTFEEVNLRFYVIRKEDNTIKRGVVFISETVPYKIVAWLANKLYHESYTTVKTKHQWDFTKTTKVIKYDWKVGENWNSIGVEAQLIASEMQTNTIEEFIFEHYYGYAKVNEHETEEYNLYHPSWKINKVVNHTITCNFKAMYGTHFELLNSISPQSVLLAEGSGVSVNWKRRKLL
jgi:uncharacterized protein